MKRSHAEKILLVGSVLTPFLLAALAEFSVRLFSDIDLLGNSRDLFIANAYGPSMGNARGVEGSSFDQIVYTDEFGFRVPRGGVPGDAGKSEALLILGDSIGFGPAVPEHETFAGLLRERFPDLRVYNSSVIGYSTPDYANVVDAFVPLHREVKTIVLAYSLNDISSSSAQNIDAYLQGPKQVNPERRLTETLRSFSWLSDANEYLRTRSKLYLLIRHNVLRTQLRDWQTVRSLYGDERAADVEHSIAYVARIDAVAKPRGIRLLVVLCPFEYQLREPGDPETQVPQRQVAALLARAGVESADARPWFDAATPSTDYFLAYDAAHFSASGHRVIADGITAALR